MRKIARVCFHIPNSLKNYIRSPVLAGQRAFSNLEICNRFSSRIAQGTRPPTIPKSPAIMRGLRAAATPKQNLDTHSRNPVDLKNSLNLPQTDFPMKANLPTNEPKMLARWAEIKIYEQIRKSRQGPPSYVLHDGPPYANGPIHLGTAMNKCLKDFIVKSKTMAGFDSPYV